MIRLDIREIVRGDKERREGTIYDRAGKKRLE
jgi:hypothetical protein